jgi:hypothetical protein
MRRFRIPCPDTSSGLIAHVPAEILATLLQAVEARPESGCLFSANFQPVARRT